MRQSQWCPRVCHPDFNEDGYPLLNLDLTITPEDWETLFLMVEDWLVNETSDFDQQQRFLPIYNLVATRACKVRAAREGEYEFDDRQTG